MENGYSIGKPALKSLFVFSLVFFMLKQFNYGDFESYLFAQITCFLIFFLTFMLYIIKMHFVDVGGSCMKQSRLETSHALTSIVFLCLWSFVVYGIYRLFS